ncbi:SMR family transporter [Leptolyngbya sp. KIOST-1]|uniref:SMR family transporter n=1 Tax=Leptolyngbya sp. KIOST-1 TaxID=1229172 RepID=UPI00056893BB|nr:SMR family transporter [Leptolyngbya sp. KIOST-1]
MTNPLIFGVLITSTVGLNTFAQVLLKMGSGKTLPNIYLLGGVLAYGISTLMYILVLSKVNLSVAYPLVIGLTVISTTVFGAAFFQEKVGITAWLGIGLMLSGIWAIAFAKN